MNTRRTFRIMRPMISRSQENGLACRFTRHGRQTAHPREGSTIVVVLALLGLLALLAVLIYTFSNQSQGNAEYFAAAANADDVVTDEDALFAYAMRQLIVGAGDCTPNSALWGGPHSLIPNMYGRDVYPFNGRGIHVISARDAFGKPTGEPIVDQNYDGGADNASLLLINNSASMMGTIDQATGNITNLGAQVAGDLSNIPHPDVDYTYPDINNVFLAYNGYALDTFGRPRKAIIPSFHRPQYLRTPTPHLSEDRDADGHLDAGEDLDGDGELDDWYAHPQTKRRVLRPHPDHVYVNPANGNILGYRYIRAAELDPASPRYDPALDAVATGPFPFAVDDVAGSTAGVNTVAGEQGLWSASLWQQTMNFEQGSWIVVTLNGGTHTFVAVQGGSTGATQPNWNTAINSTTTDGGVTWRRRDISYEYDADADGDGFKEAVYLDLEYAVQERADGTKFVPMVAFTVYDADGLLNLNAHGNLEGDLAGYAGGNLPATIEALSRSNLGMSS
ncbi:MAG: hypothetical protein ACREIV_03900, partial [Planctomycetaceae bacterium]